MSIELFIFRQLLEMKLITTEEYQKALEILNRKES